MDIKYGYLLRGITVGSPQSRSELVTVVLDSVMAGGDPLLLAVYRLAPQDMTACYSLPGRKDRNLGQYWYTTNRPPHRGRQKKWCRISVLGSLLSLEHKPLIHN